MCDWHCFAAYAQIAHHFAHQVTNEWCWKVNDLSLLKTSYHLTLNLTDSVK